jgi:hypothetical protein
MPLCRIVEMSVPHGSADMEVERRSLLICDPDICIRSSPSPGKVANALLSIQP